MTVAGPGGDDEYVSGTDSISDEEADSLELVDLPEPPPGTAVRPRRRDLQVPPPRRWERVGSLELRRCPKCHCVVPGVKAGFWHLHAVHGGEEVDEADTEAWAEDLIDEVGELRQAIRTSRGRWIHSAPLRDDVASASVMAAVVLAVIVALVAAGVVVIAMNIIGHVHLPFEGG